MDNSILSILSSLLSGQNQNLSSLFSENKQTNSHQNTATNLYPPEADIPHSPQQASQPNIMSLISALLNKNGGENLGIFSKQSTKKEEDSSPSDVIL